MRWLLICAAMGGASPSQTRRFTVVRHLAQRIHLACVPARMMTAPRLFIGLPHADVRRGLEPLEVLTPPRCHGGSRRLLLRHARSMGMDAPIVPTHMVEDLGAAGPRLQLTRMLMGPRWAADSMPTDSAHTPLPHAMWTPVVLSHATEEQEYAALKTNNDGIFWLSRRDPVTGAVLPPLDVTAPFLTQNDFFLYGRIVAPARPLCVFDRPGVLVRLMEEDMLDLQSDSMAPYAAVLLDARVAKSLMTTSHLLLNGQEASLMDIETDKLRAAMQSLRALEEEDQSGVDGAVFYTALRWCDDTNCLFELDPEAVWCVLRFFFFEILLLRKQEGIARWANTFFSTQGRRRAARHAAAHRRLRPGGRQLSRRQSDLLP